MTLIDSFIHSLIRKRFNLPADVEVDFEIYAVPTDDYKILVNWSLRENGNYQEYDSWDEFVADMEGH